MGDIGADGRDHTRKFAAQPGWEFFVSGVAAAALAIGWVNPCRDHADSNFVGSGGTRLVDVE